MSAASLPALGEELGSESVPRSVLYGTVVLTTDMIHQNTCGATIIADLIAEFLTNTCPDTPTRSGEPRSRQKVPDDHDHQHGPTTQPPDTAVAIDLVPDRRDRTGDTAAGPYANPAPRASK